MKDSYSLDQWKKSPKEKKSFFSFISHCLLDRFISSKRNKLLSVNDLPPLPSFLKTNHVWEKFRRNWNPCFPNQGKCDDATKQIKPRSLGYSLILSFRRAILFSTVLKIMYDLLSFIPTLLFDVLMNFIADSEPDWRKGYLYSFLLFTSLLVSELVHEVYMLRNNILALQLKSSLCNAIYRKVMAMSNSSKLSITSGEMFNLMTVDTNKIHDFAIDFTVLFSSPLRIIIILTFLWHYMGPSCLAVLVVFALFIPMSVLVGKLASVFQEKRIKVKDIRLKHMNEILSSIKIIKFNVWEIPFMDKVSGAREKEVKLIKSIMHCYFATVCSWKFFSFMAALACFGTYVLVDERHILSPGIVFVSLNLLSLLRSSICIIPRFISTFIQFKISLNRIQSFLLNEERDESIVGSLPDPGAVISFKNATFSWERKSAPQLTHINFDVSKGALVAVIGPVGSGKSSLLSAILGDLYRAAGSIDRKGTISYVPQDAWILNRTVAENVLFGKAVDTVKYKNILECCCLNPDLKSFPAGEMTEIGEKGINLSGGQKQRVSLARAVLQDADIYLLDDPLSAVDAHVGKSLFKNVIGNTGLLKHKTRILVTHHVSVLPYVDLIISMKDGKIDKIAKYNDLNSKEGFFHEVIEQHAKLEFNEENSKGSLCITDHFNSGDLYVCEQSISSEKLSRFKTNCMESIAEVDQGKLIQDEKMEIGGIALKSYIGYMKFIGSFIYVPYLLCGLCIQVILMCSNIWLALWSNDVPLPDGTQDISLRNQRLEIFAGFGLILVPICVFESILTSIGVAKASSKYHQLMLISVMKSPMSFFDTTPIGRIINRFSNDLEVIDFGIPVNLDAFLGFFYFLIGTVVIIGISTPMILVLFIPIVFLFYFMQRFFLMISRHIKRLDSNTRSSVLSNFQETIQSVSSIRAYSVEERFIKDFEEKLDRNFTCYFTWDLCNRWTNVCFNFLTHVIILTITLLAIENRNSMNPAALGLSFVYAVSVANWLKSFTECCSNLEMDSISLERTKEYSSLQSEAAWNMPEQELSHSWPTNGVIYFQDYATRYRKGLNLTLKGINLEIHSNEKIGLVGRTGSGKTSLTLALLRLIEAAEGSIIIDSVDISKIGLHSLRSKLTIIPQEPILFCGSLRSNLDPHNAYTDNAIWGSLERAHLKVFITSLPKGLYFEIAEGGDNLSAGQKQLICLARALLKKSKILILDEATATIDTETDALIQKTIREEFKDHTVITIAHRINTIMDYDRIVVMDSGKIEEIGKPSDLLQDPSSRFYCLAKEANLL